MLWAFRWGRAASNLCANESARLSTIASYAYVSPFLFTGVVSFDTFRLNPADAIASSRSRNLSRISIFSVKLKAAIRACNLGLPTCASQIPALELSPPQGKSVPLDYRLQPRAVYGLLLNELQNSAVVFWPASAQRNRC